MGAVKQATGSLLMSLVCSECGVVYDADALQTFCSTCRAPLLARYDLAAGRARLDREAVSARARGMWRWAELLPVRDRAYQFTLGEGDTPLLHLTRLGAELGLPHLYLKDEGSNPTGSFKARGLAAAVARAAELGVTRFIIPTAGNAGGALAAYAARAGLDAAVIMPADAAPVNLYESRILGAETVTVNGLISDAAQIAGRRAAEEGWFDVSTFKEPYRAEGKKVMGYELAEAFGWRTPDRIFYPTGGGTGLVGMVKAFAELATLGWLEGPISARLVAVQAEGCAPIPVAFASGALACEFWPGAETDAGGLRVPKSFADRQILRDLRAGGGGAVAVSDAAMREAQSLLARREGVWAALEGAAALAGLLQQHAAGEINPEERIVVFNTAAGMKSPF